MKKIITLSIFLLSISLFAQLQQRPGGSLTVLSDRGVKFKLYLNGELQNRISKTNVRVDNLNKKVYNAKIQFDGNIYSAISENNIVIASNQDFYNVTYKVEIDRRNKANLVYFDKEPIFQTPGRPDISNGNGGNRPPYGGAERPPYGGGKPPISLPRGCAGNREIRQADFLNIKNAVNNETFNADKIKLLNRLVVGSCMSTSQISELMKTYFTFDGERLEFAKLTFEYCTDPGNYYLLNPLFSFSSTKDELYEYVDSKM